MVVTISSGIILAVGIVLLLISIPMNIKKKNIVEIPSDAAENSAEEQPVYAAVSQNAPRGRAGRGPRRKAA